MDANVQVIGVDNGNSQHKTRHTCFTTGIALVDGKPIVYDNILDYNGKCYRIGGDRIKVQDGKVCNENFYMLTLASIARELIARGEDALSKEEISPYDKDVRTDLDADEGATAEGINVLVDSDFDSQ